MTTRTKTRGRWTIGTITAILLLVTAGACGSEKADPVNVNEDPDSLDNVPTTGSFQAYVQDDPTVPQNNSIHHNGVLKGKMDIEVSRDGQTWYSLGAPSDVTLALQSTNSRFVLSGKKDMPTGTYSHVRINFNSAGFVIAAGSVVNGTTLTSDVHMRMGDTGSGVARPNVTPFKLEAGKEAAIIVELNTEKWLTVSNLESRQVPKESVEHNTTVMMQVK